ncbi:hypothetical protein [Virgisporangium ochraceum]|uniref:Uncharacterized protein n=1 Tax=Virgisporangium ochraceum TaxID=65505 RepID=A0A8J4EDF6_9ACTN|nr:hypothetical protein [Virgisporangium ochraceum]GIJ71470.1 hypothetical protein Voc01_063870 [Virgisporangium ochraceum]
MLRYDEDDLVTYVAGHSSAVALVVDDTSDDLAACAALRRAAVRVSQIPHPLEPDSPLPNWCTVLHEDGVPVFHLDMKDEAQYAEQVVAIVLDELRSAGVDGQLGPRLPPPPPFDYDAEADIFYGQTWPLTELDGRDLPPGFPDGFPVPAGATLVLAETARDGTWEHAAWRRDRPFDGYTDRLRAFGCELGPVPRDEVAGFVAATCMVRYPLDRGGSVSLYHEWCKHGRQPSAWYVSVVWSTGPAPARTPPEPAVPVTYHLPPGQETAGETVLAVREAALAVEAALSGPHCHHEPSLPQWTHERLAPLFDGLDDDRLAAVRHACLTMASNWVYHGMVRMRLPLAQDDAGRLYAPDLRTAVASPGGEALLALRTAAAVLEPLFQNLRAAELAVGADRLTRTVEDLDADELAGLRDACRHVAGRTGPA